MGKRASNNKIIVVTNSVAGQLVDTTKNDKDCLVWDETLNKYVHEPRALVDHDHEIGNQVLLFENQLI